MFRNMKIAKRLMAAFGLVLALYMLSMATSLWNVSRVSESLTTFYDKSYTIVHTAWNARKCVISIERYLNKAMLAKDSKVVDECIESIHKDLESIEGNIPTIEKTYEGEASTIAELKSTFAAASSGIGQVVSLLEANEMDKAYQLVNSTYMPLLDKTRNVLSDIGYVAEDSALRHYEEGNAVKVSATLLLCIMAVVSIALTVYICLSITNGITKPVLELEKAAGKLASGDLKTQIAFHSRNELGTLADSMRNTIETLDSYISDIARVLGDMEQGNLRTEPSADFRGEFVRVKQSLQHVLATFGGTLQEIRLSANQVANGSDQVSNGAQALSQGATEQASSVEELAATFNEISVQVKSTAENAHQASERAGAVGTEAMESNRRMQDMLSAMTDISNSSTEIGKIIKTIEDIAFQTNILALNAAVEAARAGAAGKGFAVVADEVRNLANKSSEASKNTSALIGNSLRAVENGKKIADDTAHSLEAVNQGVREVTQSIDKISSASNDQAQSIVQVTQGIEQISSVVQTNSATSEESAAASQELSGQAQMLKDLVGRFQLDDSQPHSIERTPTFTEHEPLATGSSKY